MQDQLLFHNDHLATSEATLCVPDTPLIRSSHLLPLNGAGSVVFWLRESPLDE